MKAAVEGVVGHKCTSRMDCGGERLGGLNLDAARTDPESRAELGRISAFLKRARHRVHLRLQPTGGMTRQNQEDRLDEMGAFIEGGDPPRGNGFRKNSPPNTKKPPRADEESASTAESKLSREEKVDRLAGRRPKTRG